MSLAPQVPRTAAVTDLRGRQLRDLRISVTDRCNFRCTYCMPRDKFGPDHAFMSRAEHSPPTGPGQFIDLDFDGWGWAWAAGQFKNC
jgi:hypothetical protein